MGIGYTLDTPIKIGKYGISSAVSLVQDDVIEKARKFYAKLFDLPYTEINKKVNGTSYPQILLENRIKIRAKFLRVSVIMQTR